MSKLLNKIKSAIPIGDLGQYATMLAIIAITVAMGALVLQNVASSDTFTSATGTPNESAVSALDALGVFGDWLTIIAIVVVAVIVLSLIKFL
jgi:hypothetical protein